MNKFLLINAIIISGIFSSYAALNAKGVTVVADTLFQRIITEIFNPIFQAGMVITFVYFLYGVMKYVINLENQEERAKAQQHMLWGLVGVFIVFSIGGIIKTLDGLLNGIFG